MDAQTLDNLTSKVLKTQPGTELERGHSLGLVIVAKALDKLGGRLEIESVPNEGTVFTLIFN